MAAWEYLLPLTKGLDMVRAAIPLPRIQLCLCFQLLPTLQGSCKEGAVNLRQSAHVTPQFFELCNGEDVFLSVSPPLFDVFECDVGGES